MQGVDAVFIFTNTYALEHKDFAEQATQPRGTSALETRRDVAEDGAGYRRKRVQGAGYRRDVAEEVVLSKTIRHAVFVSGLSTLTTAVSFGASLASPISSIRMYAALPDLARRHRLRPQKLTYLLTYLLAYLLT